MLVDVIVFLVAHVKPSGQIDAAAIVAFRHPVGVHFAVAHHLHVGLVVDIDTAAGMRRIVETYHATVNVFFTAFEDELVGNGIIGVVGHEDSATLAGGGLVVLDERDVLRLQVFAAQLLAQHGEGVVGGLRQGIGFGLAVPDLVPVPRLAGGSGVYVTRGLLTARL